MLLSAEQWKAGMAKTTITPTQCMPMAGYTSCGAVYVKKKLTEMWFKVLVLENASGLDLPLKLVQLQ